LQIDAPKIRALNDGPAQVRPTPSSVAQIRGQQVCAPSGGVTRQPKTVQADGLGQIGFRDHVFFLFCPC
jgi:hypothetical protein